ncbi:MAG: FkbM family methyltransferase, partial [Fibromonadaceae bacterium]|nr:FkbM family methyltransferase [Fibromonadaceae bacterium]
MKEKIREIYTHLADELSIYIFENRLLFSLTEDTKYISNIVISSFKSKNKLNSIYGKYNNMVIYGAGYAGRIFIFSYNIKNIMAFCDKDENKQKKMFCGHKVISFEELGENMYNDCTIVITLLKDELIAEITEDLLKLGFSKNQILIFKEEYFRLSSELDSSLYFAPDIISPLLKEEIFVDAGCQDCATSFEFIKWCNYKYKKIIAFEPNQDDYLICVENSKNTRNMTVYPYGLWNENSEVSFDNSLTWGAYRITNELKDNLVKIRTVKLDDILNGEEVTFIKMDIEGAELNALKGAEQTILKYKP